MSRSIEGEGTGRVIMGLGNGIFGDRQKLG